MNALELAFWLAAFGTLEARGVRGAAAALALASGVILGATAWCTVLCALVGAGARFASPRWQAATRVLSAAALLYYAGRMVAAQG